MPPSIPHSCGHTCGTASTVGGGGASFTAEDEARVRSFSVYCGLALHHAKLLDKIRRSEQKLKVRRFQPGEGP